MATDGRHLFASNSLHLALPSSVLIPDHRFLSWSGFVKDGQWKLAVQPPTKDKGGYIQLESRRWTFVTKQIEGTYPNWRNITDDVREFTGTIDIIDQAAEAILRIVPRLPGDDTPNHTVGLYTVSGRLYLRGFNKDQPQATEVEVPGAKISGDPATVYVNRQYLLKAIGFGLRQIGVQEPLKPLRFSDGGSRQMIVMPVRVDANASIASAKAPVSTPVSPVIPVVASTDAAPDQPVTINPTHNQPDGKEPVTHAEHSHQSPRQRPNAVRRHERQHPGGAEKLASNRRLTKSRVSREACAGSSSSSMAWPRSCASCSASAASTSARCAACATRSRASRLSVCSHSHHPTPEHGERAGCLHIARCPALRRVHPPPTRRNTKQPTNRKNTKP